MRFYFHRQSFIPWRYLGAVPAYLQPATQLEMRKILLPECLDRDTKLGCMYAIEIQSEGICLHILLKLSDSSYRFSLQRNTNQSWSCCRL